MSKRKLHAPELTAKMALKALKGEETASELASRFGDHPTMIHQWKRAQLDHQVVENQRSWEAFAGQHVLLSLAA